MIISPSYVSRTCPKPIFSNKSSEPKISDVKQLKKIPSNGGISYQFPVSQKKFNVTTREESKFFSKQENSSFIDKIQSVQSYSVQSIEDDERVLLKSIQCDVMNAIEKYQFWMRNPHKTELSTQPRIRDTFSKSPTVPPQLFSMNKPFKCRQMSQLSSILQENNTSTGNTTMTKDTRCTSFVKSQKTTIKSKVNTIKTVQKENQTPAIQNILLQVKSGQIMKQTKQPEKSKNQPCSDRKPYLIQQKDKENNKKKQSKNNKKSESVNSLNQSTSYKNVKPTLSRRRISTTSFKDFSSTKIKSFK